METLQQNILTLLDEAYPNKILQEDDAAPDAREYFSIQFEKETGLKLHNFQFDAEISVRAGTSIYKANREYLLTIDSGDPFYKLYKK